MLCCFGVKGRLLVYRGHSDICQVIEPILGVDIPVCPQNMIHAYVL